MDIGKSLTFVFDDRKWVEKLLIGGLLTLAATIFSWTIIGPLLVVFLLMGYMIDVVRNVRAGKLDPLPEWDEWGRKIGEGLKLTIIFLIWSLPLIIIWTPTTILLAAFADSDAAGIVATLSLCVSCISILYGIVLFLASPAITIRFAETNDFGSGFEFSRILSFTRDHLAQIIVVVIVLWVVQIIASFVGILLCGIGLVFTTFWATLVQGHLYGQIGLEPGTALVPAAAAPVVPPAPADDSSFAQPEPPVLPEENAPSPDDDGSQEGDS